MNSNRDKIQKLKNYFRDYPNATYKFKKNSLSELDPSYIVIWKLLKQRSQASSFNTFFAQIHQLYIAYAGIRRHIPPMFSGLHLSPEMSDKMRTEIQLLKLNFVQQISLWLDMIDANKFIDAFSGFQEYDRMDDFKKDLQDYYASRQVKAPYNILEVLGSKCAFLSVTPNIQYISKITNQINILRGLVNNLKLLYEDSTIDYALIHTGENFVDFANLIHNIDYMLFGNLPQIHNWVRDDELVFNFLLDFTEDTISITDRDYYRHSDNVHSPFLAFIRDLQLFRFRMKQYFDIISNPVYANDEDEIFQKELELFEKIQREDVAHGYFQGNITYKFSAKPVVIEKTNFKSIKINTSNLELMYVYKDMTTVQENRAKIKQLFDDVVSIIDHHGLNSIVYRSLNKIVIVNYVDNQNPGFVEIYHGFYLESSNTLYIYLEPNLFDSYFRVKEMEYEWIHPAEYDRLSKAEKKEYRKYNIHIVLHELGHNIHYLMSEDSKKVWTDNVWIFDAETQKQIHLDADNKHMSSYAIVNSDEDFAETFAFALQEMTTPLNQDSVKRLERALNHAIKDGLDIQPYSNNDDLNELVRMVDFNILSKYLGVQTIMLKFMFSFSKKENTTYSAYLGKLDDFANFTFHPDIGYYDKKTLPIGFIEIDSPFFLNKISGQFVILISYVINVLLLEFTKSKGRDFVIGQLGMNGIAIDHFSPFQQIIEKASVQLAKDIYAWTKNRDTLEPTHRDLLKEILSEFIN